jgi:RecA-family ATPase
MPNQLTKQGALQVTADLDRLATLFMSETETLGLPEKIAKDFALRCDILSDHVEKRAGVERTEDGSLKDPELAKYASALSKRAQMDPKKNYTMEDVKPNEFNPAEIGEEQSGALLRNQDEPYMDVFKQDEFDQLRQVQQDGMFSNAKAASALIAKMAKLLSDNKVKVPVAAG